MLIRTRTLFEKEEDCVDTTAGKCPACPKGLLAVDIEKSFEFKVHGKWLPVEIIVCDRCDFVKQRMSAVD